MCVRAGPWVKWGLAATIRSDLMRSRGHNSNKSKNAPVTQSKLHSHRATDKQISRHKSKNPSFLLKFPKCIEHGSKIHQKQYFIIVKVGLRPILSLWYLRVNKNYLLEGVARGFFSRARCFMAARI